MDRKEFLSTFGIGLVAVQSLMALQHPTLENTTLPFLEIRWLCPLRY